VNIELYETAQPGEWWCGVCKRGHEYDTACPDSGQIVESVKVTNLGNDMPHLFGGLIMRKVKDSDTD